MESSYCVAGHEQTSIGVLMLSGYILETYENFGLDLLLD